MGPVLAAYLVLSVLSCFWGNVAGLACGGTATSTCSTTQNPPSTVPCFQNGAAIANTGAQLTLNWRCGITTPSATCTTNYAANWNAPSNSQSGGSNPVLRVNCPGGALSSIGAWNQAQPASALQYWIDETNTGYISVNNPTSGSTLAVYVACR